MLVRNPEYYTIWNYRRRTLRHLLADAQVVAESPSEAGNSFEPVVKIIDEDLVFLLPLLRKFPKCYWIWNYRLWLLEEASRLLPRPMARNVWDQELSLVGKMLTLDNRNFHGWGYRRTLIKALESPALQVSDGHTQLTQQEFDYTTIMINTSLSNFSAWHQRSKLIPRLLEERQAPPEARRQMFDEGKDMLVEASRLLTRIKRIRSHTASIMGRRH